MLANIEYKNKQKKQCKEVYEEKNLKKGDNYRKLLTLQKKGLSLWNLSLFS